LPIETVNLPLTGAGDNTVRVAVDDTAAGVVQLFKIVVSADGVSTLVPADIDGLFVQSIERAESPQDVMVVATALAAGANADLNGTDIATGKTGRLMAVDVGASVPARWDIQTVNGSRVTRTTLYTGFGDHRTWRPPSPVFIELAGGIGKHFGLSVTNLHSHKAADLRGTLYWDEV
jgi:hypothetical protein